MKPVGSRLLFIFFLLLILPCPGQEVVNPKVYNCVYTPVSIRIDGIADEEAWGLAKWSDAFIDIRGKDQPVPYLKTRMKMLWSKHYLYITATMEEHDLWGTLKDRDAIIYHDNDFEVFADPDGDGLNYYELEINVLGTEFDLFLNKAYNKMGRADIGWNMKGLQSAVSTSGTINDPSDEDESWSVEIAIPWEAFDANKRQMPKNGEYWKMNFSRVQWELETKKGRYVKNTDPETGTVLPEHNWVWSAQGVVNMHIPERWGIVEFTGYREPDPSAIPEYWVWSGAPRLRPLHEWDSLLNVLEQAGIHGLLLAADTLVLKKVIPLAEKHNIRVHAWMWTMNSKQAKPEWLSVNRLGKSLADEKAYVDYYKFMCPALPEVQDFIISNTAKLLTIEGLKGIHLDYIRYVDAILPEGLWDKYKLVQEEVQPRFDYGYHPYMRKLYEDKYGIDPLLLDDPGHDSSWLQFRLDKLTETVIRLRDFIRQEDFEVSAAVFPTPSMSRTMVRQDWDKWGLDFYFPMVYHGFYNEDADWIKSVVEENKKSLPTGSRVFCGLFLPDLLEGDDLEEAAEAARLGGADGIAFFDLNAITPSLLQKIKKITGYEKQKP